MGWSLRMKARERARSAIWNVPVGLQLSVIYTLLLAALLIVLGGALYIQLNSSLTGNRAAQLISNTQTGLARFLPFSRDPGHRSPFGVDQDQLATNLVRVLSGPDVNVAVLDVQGNPVAQTESTLSGATPFFPRLPENWQQIIANLPQNSPPAQWVLSGPDGGRYLVLVQTIGVAGPGGTVSLDLYLEQVASLASADSVLNQLRLYIIVGIILGILIGVPAGLALTRVVLRPLDRMVRTAEAISGGDLGRRLHLPAGRNEVARLGSAFDHMVDRLAAALEAQRRFVADASHELRTPLTSLEGLSEILMMGADRGDVSVVQRMVRSMYSELRRMSRLVTDLLILSRVDSTTSLTLQAVDAGRLVDEVAEQMAPLAESKQVRLEASHPGPVRLQADPDRLKQVLLNFVDNAIRYTPPGGQVWISASPGPGRNQVQIQVRDTGQGIPQEDLPHIFDRFYRGDPSRSRATGNSGLGLAIAKAIVESHGGTITASSMVGLGTTFTVTLPTGNLAVPSEAPVLEAVPR